MWEFGEHSVHSINVLSLDFIENEYTIWEYCIKQSDTQYVLYMCCIKYKNSYVKNQNLHYLIFNLFFEGLTAAAAAAAAATNAAIAKQWRWKKIKLEAMSNYHASNNSQHGADSENGTWIQVLVSFLFSETYCNHFVTKWLSFTEPSYWLPIQEVVPF